MVYLNKQWEVLERVAKFNFSNGTWTVEEYCAFCRNNNIPNYWEFLVAQGIFAF